MPDLNCNPIEQEARQAYLEALYLLAGRDRPGAHNAHTYTGLLQERQQELLRRDALELSAASPLRTETPVHDLLGSSIRSLLIEPTEGSLAATSVICRILAARISITASQLAGSDADRAPVVMATIDAVAGWLRQEALLAERALIAHCDPDFHAIPVLDTARPVAIH